MILLLFFVFLLVSTMITNRKNEAKETDDNLLFDERDSLIVLLCMITAPILDKLLSTFLPKYYWIGVVLVPTIYLAILMIVNLNRENLIKEKQEIISKIYDGLSQIFGKVKREDIDFTAVPFTYELDSKTREVTKIEIDLNSNGRFDENNITICVYNLNKYFPNYQWIDEMNIQKRILSLIGLPKPPEIAKFPGTDYRPAGWIPLGVGGKGEIGWNLGNPKEMGLSSFIDEEGKEIEFVKTSPLPQAFIVGGTGGGKAIWECQEVDVA